MNDPYEGTDPRLAWMLRVLSDEFGMLGVLKAQQAAFDYVNTDGEIDNRFIFKDEAPVESLVEESWEALVQKVYESLGAASVCWDDLTYAGVFHSDRAADIGKMLTDEISKFAKGRMP